MPQSIDRRHFLVLSSALSVAAAAGRVVGAEPAGSAGSAGEAVQLIPAADQDLFRVRMQMSVKGNVDIPKNPLASKERDRQLPLVANSTIDFEERWVRGESELMAGAQRYYYEATSESKVEDRTQTRELRDKARRVVAHVDAGLPVLYGEEDYLTHDELELLRTPVCSLAIDAILPAKAVAPGASWSPDTAGLARLFNLAGIQKSTVTGEVVSIDAKQAKLQFQGRIDGSIDGVPTVIELAAKAVFDRDAGAVTWFALALREQREIGKAEPGFQVAAQVKLIRQPLEEANAVRTDDSLDFSAPPPEERMMVHLDSSIGRFTVFLDRSWRMISDAKGLTTLRMIKTDKVIAQCDIRPLVAMKPGEQLTLEAFQADIRRSLSSRFGSFLEAEEGVNSGGLRTMRVAVQGEVEQVPVQWVFLHFSDDSGRRVAATFTLEATQVEAFAGADAQFANTFRFQAAAEEPAEQQAAKASSADRK
ncbi:hypothetical protein [Candidatus Laterigemmans baculatus]|uniref:hypothetical protein n=1 Tax=Candidatus Laterigemmans baculatus TaxID=2770505 RepID=UPI0013DD2737|nr:hypothetical protein [Candidatus Laterigemmans baculatus]